MRFVVSSGRRYSTLRWMFEPVADRIDYVASLGTQVWADGRQLGREVFSTMAVNRLFETCNRFDCLHLALYDETRTFLLNDRSPRTCASWTRTSPRPSASSTRPRPT